MIGGAYGGHEREDICFQVIHGKTYSRKTARRPRLTRGTAYYRLGQSFSACGLVVRCCDNGNEHTGFITLGNLLNGLET